ncbi:unnamed protein product [Withania somnifera]
MSDRITQSYSDCDGRTGKSTHSVQSVWMAHWNRYNSTAETNNHASIALGNKENDQDSKPLLSIVKLETMSKLSKSVKRLRESETRTFEVINESLRTSSRTIAKETLGNWSLQLHNPCENVKTPFHDSLDCDKTHSHDIGRSIVASRPLLDNPSHLASHLVPHREPGQYITEKGERTQTPFISRFLAAKEEVPRLGILEHEHGKLVTPYLRQNDSFWLDAPSISRKLLPEFGREEFQKIPGGSFIRLLKNEPSPSQVTESKELHPCSFDQQKLPHPLFDVETSRTSNTVDSVVAMAGYCPRISQTTQSMLITNRTDADQLEGDNVIDNSRTSNETNGKVSLNNRDSQSNSFGRYKGGRKLQIQNCFTGYEKKESIACGKPFEFVLKNESSAETNTMDMDVVQEKNQLCDMYTILSASSSIVKKVNKMDQNSPLPLAHCSRNEAGRKQFKLDINLELPAPTDNMEASSSRTESLELGSILTHAERPSSSRNDLCPGLLGQDPASRWVKRLKVSGSDSLAFGTKSSSLVGDISHEKSHKTLSKIPKAIITSSELASSKRPGKELMVHNNISSLAINSSPSSTSVIKNNMELLTSHSWIQRLLHNRAITASKMPQPVTICEPQKSKLELDDLQKKQLPSLGG